MQISLEHARSAFSPYKPVALIKKNQPPPVHRKNCSTHSSSCSSEDDEERGVVLRNNHVDDEDDTSMSFCFVCVDMARDTPGSPMSRSARDQLAAAAATATLTSGAYHVTAATEHAAAAAVALHGNALQQKILEVMCFRQLFMCSTLVIIKFFTFFLFERKTRLSVQRYIELIFTFFFQPRCVIFRVLTLNICSFSKQEVVF